MSPEQVATGFSRRSLLKYGAVGVLALGAASVGLAMQGTRRRPLPKGGLKVLSPAEYAVLAAIAERLCPPPGPGAPGANALDVAAIADRAFEGAAPEGQEGIKRLLRIFDNGLTGALFGRRVVPFTELDARAQEAELESWRSSRVGFRRTVHHSLSSMVQSLYFAQPETWERIGYPGPPSPTALREAYAENLVDWAALRAKGPEGAR